MISTSMTPVSAKLSLERKEGKTQEAENYKTAWRDGKEEKSVEEGLKERSPLVGVHATQEARSGWTTEGPAW